jgi:hypothetical protein
VAVDGSAFVAVGDGEGSPGPGSVVWVGDGGGIGVFVSEGDVEVARAAAGLGGSVAGGAAPAESVGEDSVDVVVKGGDAGLQRKRKKRIKRMIATINLKMSYPCMLLEECMDPL